jgi:hypothetical protein
MLGKSSYVPGPAGGNGDGSQEAAEGSGAVRGAGMQHASPVGRTRGPPLGRRTGRGRAAVRVLRESVDRGLAGPRVVAGPAAGAGRCASPRARDHRGRALRCRGEPVGGVGAAPAGRGAGRCPGGPGPGLGRRDHRGVRAGVLRRPVRADGAAVRALRGAAVAAGGGRPGRLRLRARRGGDDGAGAVVEAGGDPDQHPGPYRDGGPDQGAGPVPGRPAAVRVPAG